MRYGQVKSVRVEVVAQNRYSGSLASSKPSVLSLALTNWDQKDRKLNITFNCIANLNTGWDPVTSNYEEKYE